MDAETFAAKTPGFSGAQLSNMINEAALAAAKTGVESITSAMLDEARDKVMMGRERTLTRTEVRFLYLYIFWLFAFLSHLPTAVGFFPFVVCFLQ